MLTRNIIKQQLFLLLFVTTSQLTLASDDEYLKQLEMEAESISETSSSTEAATDTTQELVVDKKELIHNIKSFERALKQEHPQNYTMYQEFDDQQKKQVYNSFLKHKRLYDASVKVTLIYIQSH